MSPGSAPNEIQRKTRWFWSALECWSMGTPYDLERKLKSLHQSYGMKMRHTARDNGDECSLLRLVIHFQG